MKIVVIIFLFLISPFVINSQCTEHLAEKNGQLFNKNRETKVTVVGNIEGGDPNDKEFYYIDYEKPIMDLGYTKAMWVAGKTVLGDIAYSANWYPNVASKHFVPGPYLNDTVDQEFVCDFFNRAWKVSQLELLVLKENYESGTLTSDQIPIDILEWPAQGNPWINEYAPSYDMAPFFDNNNDGIYNPLHGDYPVVDASNLNLQPYQFNFSVYNDNSKLRFDTDSNVKMEFHQIRYVFNCGDELSKSIVTRLKYIYRGNSDLRDVRFGLFEDNDLACAMEIEIGCDTSLNATYSYKYEPDPFGCELQVTIPEELTSIRTTIFSEKILSSIFFRNAAFSGYFQQNEPEIPIDYYSLLSGVWRDGTPITIGGNGFLEGTEETLFCFEGLPHLPNNWTSIGLDLGDPRKVTSFLALDLMPGASGYFEFIDHVQVFDLAVGINAFESYTETITDLKSEYEDVLNGGECLNVELCESDCIWPGDVNNNGIVSIDDMVSLGVGLLQNNTDTIERAVVSSEWFPFESVIWNDQIEDYNSSFADVNGNGIVNENDMDYLLANLGLSHSNYAATGPVKTEFTDKGLAVELSNVEYDASRFEINLFERFLEPLVRFGSPSREINEPIHGISFRLAYDTMFVENIGVSNGVSSSNNFEYAYSDYVAGTFGFIGETSERGFVQYAFSRLEEGDIEEGFILLRPTLIFKEYPETGNVDRRDTFKIDVVDIFALNSNGERIEIGSQSVDVVLTNLIYNPDLVSTKDVMTTSDNLWNLSPNPAEDWIDIRFENVVSGKVELISLDGRQLKSKEVLNTDFLRINLGGLSGLHFLIFTNQQGEKIIQKVEVVF